MERVTHQAVLESIRDLSRPDRPVYLVGGAVRDQLLNRPGHDLDFTLPGETLSAARIAAKRLHGNLYVMDEARAITRVVIEQNDGERMLLDFAGLRQENLEADLFDRDFTVNAMAFDIASPDRLIDPTGGLADLRAKQLRACSASSLKNDPVRVLRAVRMSLAFQLQILPDTVRQMRLAAPLIAQVSAERVRDELLRILGGPKVGLGVRVLDQVGALAQALPELQALKTQILDHSFSAWEHTLDTLRYLEQLLAPLVGVYREETVPDLTVGSAVLWLGRYRRQFEAHFQTMLVPGRSLRSQLFLAALYADLGASPLSAVPPTPEAGDAAGLLSHRAHLLALSAQEITHLNRIIRHRVRVHAMAVARLTQMQENQRRRAAYQFFKATQEAGVDICLLSLASLRAAYTPSLPQGVWQAELETCRMLLDACWEMRDTVIQPPRLLTGSDLMQAFNLKPSRTVGQLLEMIEEGQAAGEIVSAEQAIAFAQKQLEAGLLSSTPPQEKG